MKSTMAIRFVLPTIVFLLMLGRQAPAFSQPLWQPPAQTNELSALQRCIQYGGEIAVAALRHKIDPLLLAAIAAQETGGPNQNSGSNRLEITQRGFGTGYGLFQIDNKWHSPFTSSMEAMVPAFNADYAARFFAQLLLITAGSVPAALSRWNSGSSEECGTPTRWPSLADPICYAESVYKHWGRLRGLSCQATE